MIALGWWRCGHVPGGPAAGFPMLGGKIFLFLSRLMISATVTAPARTNTAAASSLTLTAFPASFCWSPRVAEAGIFYGAYLALVLLAVLILQSRACGFSFRPGAVGASFGLRATGGSAGCAGCRPRCWACSRWAGDADGRPSLEPVLYPGQSAGGRIEDLSPEV